MSTTFTAVDSRTATRSYAGNVCGSIPLHGALWLNDVRRQAHFEANADRKNLFVLTSAIVSKIKFRPGSSHAVATGVEFLHHGQRYHAAVNKEVILSAGKLERSRTERITERCVARLPSDPANPRTVRNWKQGPPQQAWHQHCRGSPYCRGELAYVILIVTLASREQLTDATPEVKATSAPEPSASTDFSRTMSGPQ